MILKIKRNYFDDCTIGTIEVGKFRAFTLELPWLNNQRNISCIPAGLYECTKHFSSKNGECIAVHDVLMRDYIQIHFGNRLEDTQGCVLVGDSQLFQENGEPMVTNSRKTMAKLLKLLPETFLMEIK